MIFNNHISPKRRLSGEGSRALPGAIPVHFPPVRILSGRSVLITLCFLALTSLALAGCGQGIVPCPTPTLELDRLRDETDRTRAEMERSLAEERALKARREAAAQRATAARQTLDSLAALGSGR